MKIGVIGGGLFGSIMTKALRKEGHEVVVHDHGVAGSGSMPAACLIKPSWVAGLGAHVVDPAMAKLRELYNVQDIEFQVGPIKQTVQWIDPASILIDEYHYTEADEVTSISPGLIRTLEWTHTYDHIILAAGVWTDSLIPEGLPKSGVEGRAGVAFLLPNARIERPFISPWAPYRQLVAFNRGDGLWVSDGTALKTENLTEKRIEESWMRCRGYLPTEQRMGSPVERLVGIRPYVSKAKPCYYQQHDSWLTVVTGGAKNGTLAAGWAAHRIVEDLA